MQLDPSVRTLIRSMLQRSDRQAVDRFIQQVEIILTWRRKFLPSASFPATQLWKIHKMLTQTVAAIEKARPTTCDHLERAFYEYTEGTIAPRMAMEMLKGYVTTLNSYINLRSPKNPQGGRPPKAQMVATIAAIATAYQDLLRRRPSAAERSPFAEIIAALLPALDPTCHDPRRLIRRALDKPSS